MIFPHAKRASVRRDAGKLDFVQNAAADQVDADQLGFSLSHACVEIGMRAAPLNHGRTAGPQAEDRDAGMDIQNVKIAASSGCPEIQVVALALHVGVQIPAPAERRYPVRPSGRCTPILLCDGPDIHSKRKSPPQNVRARAYAAGIPTADCQEPEFLSGLFSIRLQSVLRTAEKARHPVL